MIPPRAILGKIGNAGLAALLGLIVLEGVLEVRDRYARVPVVSNVVPDSRLGFRPNPKFPGHDIREWGNSTAPGHTDIVIMGDSLVYGAVWPRLVGERLHRTVYKLAADGYGPAQYVLLLEEALALKPKVILATFDFGDDLYDSYEFLYRIGVFKRSAEASMLDGVFTLPDEKVQSALRQVEAIDPALMRRKYLDCRSPVVPPDPRLQAVRDILSSPPLRPLSEIGNPPRLFTYLADHSVLLDAIRRRLFATKKPGEKAEVAWPDLCPRYDDLSLSTLFNPGYRKLVLDPTDPRIVEGERITLRSYQYIAERCKVFQCMFYVVMIPTKETAFRRRVEPTLGHQAHLLDLWKAEERARANAQEFLGREHIAAIDTLPALQEVILSGINPYPTDADGHPVEVGYKAIASSVVERLERDGMGDRR